MVIILFGVTGAGKTTIGRLLAQQLGWPFYDGDDFHSPANVDKLRRGVPLKNRDRRPWLESLQTAIEGWLNKGENVVLACSALKRDYRQYLRISDEVRFVYLRGGYDLIEERLRTRRGHFMNADLLQSQFETLQEPVSEEAVVVDCDKSPRETVEQVRQELEI